MKILEFWIANWSVIVAAICITIVTIQKIVTFTALPTEKKRAEILARLLEWVRQAESDLGGGTGKFKLSQVYDTFCNYYPEMKKWFSIEDFNKLVDQALAQMEESFKNENVKKNALGE